MKRVRLLVWMVALVALLMPQGMSVHAMATAQPAASVDCPDHAPLPPCPDHGSAKHAAGDCCPIMAGALALLPQPVVIDHLLPLHLLPAKRAPSLAGEASSKDPPPPRA
jgi:hypothetical protein